MARRTIKARNFALLALPLVMALSACGGDGTGEDAGDLDAELLDDSRDPAMTGALEDQILVDPDLTQQNGRNAALSPGGPPQGAVPADSGPADGAASGRGTAIAQLRPTGGIMQAPKPSQAGAGDCESCGQGGVTLGAMAESQANAQGGRGNCDATLTYSAGWAARMPAPFPVYPRGRVKEAAGVDNGACNVRVVNFTTKVALKDVVDYYYTRARRSGYTAEYVLRGGDHVLGGTRQSDDGAYVVFLTPMADGGTEVDIVANNGR